MLVAGLLASPAVAAPPANAADGTTYFWRWSDGSRAATRTFTEAAYLDAGRLPSLIVTAVPAGRRAPVRLAVRRAGHWLTEDGAATGGAGVAVVALNPYCLDGDWCDERQDYRLSVDGQSVRLAITYLPDHRGSGRTRAN